MHTWKRNKVKIKRCQKLLENHLLFLKENEKKTRNLLKEINVESDRQYDTILYR